MPRKRQRGQHNRERGRMEYGFAPGLQNLLALASTRLGEDPVVLLEKLYGDNGAAILHAAAAAYKRRGGDG